MLPNRSPDHYYLIALSMIDGIGSKTARSLLQHFKTAEAIFHASPKQLRNIAGVGDTRAKLFQLETVKAAVEKEMEFVEKHKIEVLSLQDANYPKRLLQCDDAPLLLYYKGNANLNSAKMCAIIGTRKNTDYGQRCTEMLIEQLAGQQDLIIVSGLALGIDTIAHKNALLQNLPTVGVMGHGLDRIYPFTNKNLANEMVERGGLLTEFPSGTKPDRQNFPVRNRIVAGMCDVSVIVESDIKGGAMITAYVALSYNRELAAFPGRIYDSKSEGPNHLIRQNMAAMITNATDLLQFMNWEQSAATKAVQQQLFAALSPDEQKLIELLQSKDAVHVDELMKQIGLNYPQLAATLLQLEMQNLIKTLPGKMYRLN